MARAYRELETSGIVETRGRGGTYVAAGADHTAQRARELADCYATQTSRLGLTAEQSLRYVRAALGLIGIPLLIVAGPFATTLASVRVTVIAVVIHRAGVVRSLRSSMLTRRFMTGS